MKRFPIFLALVAAVAGLGTRATGASTAGADDVVVMAIIDNAFSPYHFDYRASMMPQATDADPSNDLPLDQPPHTWLPGFPDPAQTFASYEPLALSLPTVASARGANLFTTDAAKWDAVQRSTPDAVNMYWIPGTKIIGAAEFGESRPFIYGDHRAHGTGTTSVGVGNIHGTCPECLLVFLGYDNTDQAQAILDWAHAQPWIDIVSNSYGINTMSPVTRAIGGALGSRDPGVTFRDQLYAGPIERQRAASERGQTIVFSAGNGIENGFITPHSTYTSSIKGADWVITVGAVASTPPHPSYSGAGKPVDVAGVGDGYPSAYNSVTVGGTRREFSGTSNAAPTVAGTYARALHLARRNLVGPSRVQQNGVVAVGEPYACGSARVDCELGDGVLTAEELRMRVLRAPSRTGAGTSVGGLATIRTVREEDLLQQGHGAFLARLNGIDAWLAEFDRVLAPLEGRAPAAERAQDERDFMIVDSYCRQKLWGTWSGGYWQPNVALAPADTTFPVRSALATACQALPPRP